MSTRTMKCPHKCGATVGIHPMDSDAVECACTECGGEFTAGEARRGHLYVKEQAAEDRNTPLERRVEALESAVRWS
jgi:hypothetical protein